MDQKQEEEAAKQAEQFESIPWSSLVPDTSSRNKRILIVGLTVVAGILIGLVAGRVIRGATQPGVVVTLPPVAGPEAAAAPVVTSAPQPSATVGPEPAASEPQAPATTAAASSPVQAPIPPRLYSEADLMAVLPEEEMRAAVMRAEWFVTDFFTVDGETTAAGDVAAALPEGHRAAPLPHESRAGISYVEWARAYRVEPLGPGRYRIAVAFRSLAGPAVGNLTRSPVRSVAVDVAVGAGGATAVLDFPSPLPPPEALAVPVPEVPEMDAPADVAADALRAAARVGADPGLLVAGLGDDGWRVVVLVGDDSGLRWPLSVRP